MAGVSVGAGWVGLDVGRIEVGASVGIGVPVGKGIGEGVGAGPKLVTIITSAAHGLINEPAIGS